MSVSATATSPPSEASSDDASPRPRWEGLRLTPRFRRQARRALVVVAIFLAFVGSLALAFGISILQYTLAGFVLGTIVMVAAMGLTLIYGIRRFANFAYGDLMTLGAYVAIVVNLFGGLALFWGAFVAFLILGLVGILLEVLIFARLEVRGPVAPIVASVGLGLIIQNSLRAVAGTGQWNYAITAIPEIPIVEGLGIHPIRGIATLVVGFSFMLSTHMLLKYTNLGKAMRATADNLELAKATGIDTKRVTYAAWALSCSFASAAGVLLGLIAFVQPTTGFDVLLLLFAAVIIGGIGSPHGAMLGALVVGLSQEMSIPLLLWLGRSDVLGLEHATAYKIAIPFLLMIGVLLLRPWGIAGRPPAFAPRAFFLERMFRVLAREAAGNRAGGDQPGNE